MSAGVISVYWCGRVAEKNKIPNESVIVTFAESVRPSEIEAWPFIYRVESFSPRPLQCASVLASVKVTILASVKVTMKIVAYVMKLMLTFQAVLQSLVNCKFLK